MPVRFGPTIASYKALQEDLLEAMGKAAGLQANGGYARVAECQRNLVRGKITNEGCVPDCFFVPSSVNGSLAATSISIGRYIGTTYLCLLCNDMNKGLRLKL